jgi:hypothetical protein
MLELAKSQQCSRMSTSKFCEGRVRDEKFKCNSRTISHAVLWCRSESIHPIVRRMERSLR